jgi:hypothetical protein
VSLLLPSSNSLRLAPRAFNPQPSANQQGTKSTGLTAVWIQQANKQRIATWAMSEGARWGVPSAAPPCRKGQTRLIGLLAAFD